MCHFSSYRRGNVPAIRDIIYFVFMTWKRGTRPLCSLQQQSWKTFLIESKARKTNLFNAMVKEAKVKDFAVLFLALSWFHQGNLEKLSSNISKSTLINFRLNIFFTYIVSLSGISFHNLAPKIGTACLSFSRLNFVMNILFLEDDLVL